MGFRGIGFRGTRSRGIGFRDKGHRVLWGYKGLGIRGVVETTVCLCHFAATAAADRS